MTFPLQNLPFLAFKNVVHQFRINDLLDMTMTSDIFKKRVEEFKIKIEILSWDYPNIVTINSFDTMTFYIYTDPEVTNKSKKVNNTLVNLRKNHGGPNRDSGAISTHFRFYHDETQTNLEIQEELIIHLLSIFNVDEYHLDWNPFVGSILDSYVWKYCKNFYCLMVNGPREEWTPEEMEFVMTEIKSEILEWTGNSHAYKFRGKLDTETMVLRIEEGESWFTQEALLLADFQTLELYGAMTAAELDLNSFIKNWLTRRDDKLETFDITLVRDGFSTVGIQITGILHDIQTTGTHFHVLRRMAKEEETLSIRAITDYAYELRTLFPNASCFYEGFFETQNEYKKLFVKCFERLERPGFTTSTVDELIDFLRCLVKLDLIQLHPSETLTVFFINIFLKRVGWGEALNTWQKFLSSLHCPNGTVALLRYCLQQNTDESKKSLQFVIHRGSTFLSQSRITAMYFAVLIGMSRFEDAEKACDQLTSEMDPNDCLMAMRLMNSLKARSFDDQFMLDYAALCLRRLGLAKNKDAAQNMQADLLRILLGLKGQLYTLQLNVTNQKSVDSAKEIVMKILDEQKAKLWGLVNNAGIFSIHGPDDWCSVDEYASSLNVNTLGAVRMCHAFVPLIKKSRGRVVTMGSTAGRLHGLYVAPYVTAKFAVEAYMDCLRLEMRQYGVSVHILEPGCFKTELLNQDAQRMRIQRIWNNLSEETKEEYGEDYRRNFETAWESGVNVVANPNIGWVVDCYSHALFSWWPRLRYCPGWDAIFMFIPLSVFPTALQDWILAGLYRLSPGPSLTPAVLVKNKKHRTPVQWIQFFSQLAILPLLYTIFFVKNTQKQTVETAHPHNVTVSE